VCRKPRAIRGATASLTRQPESPTITRYLDLLQEASVIALLPGIDGQGIVPKAQPKVYFLDNGILSMLLADDRLFEVRKPEDQAMLLENFVVSELIKRYSYAGDKLTELGYLWHPKGEIDIVAFRNGSIQHACLGGQAFRIAGRLEEHT
jgi:predicted AAA+ superfamily ATPase